MRGEEGSDFAGHGVGSDPAVRGWDGLLAYPGIGNAAWVVVNAQGFL
jgi:hypothetical protein